VEHKFGENFVVGVLRVHMSMPAAGSSSSSATRADGSTSGIGGGGVPNSSGSLGVAAPAAAPAALAGADAAAAPSATATAAAPSADAAAAATAKADALLAQCEGVEAHAHAAGSFGAAGAVEGRDPYTLCVVMPRGERSLLDALQVCMEGVECGWGPGRLPRTGTHGYVCLRVGVIKECGASAHPAWVMPARCPMHPWPCVRVFLGLAFRSVEACCDVWEKIVLGACAGDVAPFVAVASPK
jgi:hypothetical protein